MAVTVAGVLLTPVVSTILGNLNALAFGEFATARSFKTELKNLESTLTVIQAVLQDAEEQQWKSETVKNWLRKLKDAAYDADDVLDEIAIEAQRRGQKRDMKNRVRSFISSHNPLVFQVKMGRKLKKVRGRLDAIASEKINFFLEGTEDKEANSFDWRLTSSLVNDSEICGRDKEKEEFIDYLLSSSDYLSIYAIVGIGGIGKTALAQLIYNDGSVERQFDLRIWVCVSNDFNIMRLTNSIIESIEGNPCSLQGLDPLQRRLQEKLTGKKFLLVLDDVWDDSNDKWHSLKDVLRLGSEGSVVIITTRIEKVAHAMEPVFVKRMGGLSDDDSWCLFKRHAFGIRGNKEYKHLETIGKSIVDKCCGAPLAIKVLGNLMRFKKEESEWLSIKESNIWDLQEEGNKILSVLRLSYNNLPPHLKQCFAFSSVFPKDFVMEKDQLIALWMANGFISRKSQMDLHDIGNEIFDDLVGRSFFQDVKDDWLGNITCKMHDLIHDLARSIMMHEVCLIEHNIRLEIPMTVRHVAFHGKLSSPDGLELHLPNVQTLRSLFLFDDGSRRNLRDTLHLYFHRQKHLRALTLRNFKFYKLPEAVAHLKHLRYLDVSGSSIETLPEATSSLQNLETLDLRNCESLHLLPKGMKHLKNLKYLDIRGCRKLRCMPDAIGQLIGLQKLSMFIVGEEDGHHIGELGRLNDLRDGLSIKYLDNVKSLTDARNANLMRKKTLQSLTLSWRQDKESENSEQVLRGLQPNSNLKKLGICGYGGSKFPNWMMNLLLPNLVEMSLEWCCNCEHLPPFGKLQFLKNLRLKGMSSVRYIDNDFYGRGEISFPSLETLSFDSMWSLEKWACMTGRTSFPRLCELTVHKCPRLYELPTVPSVKMLHVGKGSVTLLGSVMNFTSLTSLSMMDFDELTHLPERLLENHTLLESLEIDGLRSLKSLSTQLDNLCALKRLDLDDCEELESLPQGLWNLNSLETLWIEGCRRLNSLSIHRSCGLSSLRVLWIQCCHEFASLSGGVRNLAVLESLILVECPKIKSLPESIQHLASLRKLTIRDCRGLSCLPNQIGQLTSLSILEIEGCHNLMHLPDGVRSLNILRKLIINACPNLERRCEKERGEDWLKIAHITKIVINGEEIQSLDGSEIE